MTYRVNMGPIKRVNKRILRYVKRQLPKETLAEFKQNTPVDQGNARRKTNMRKTFKGFKITANYKYAGVLDEGGFPNPPIAGTGKTRNGYSTQAPKGMIKPTVEWLEQTLRQKVKGFTRIRGSR